MPIASAKIGPQRDGPAAGLNGGDSFRGFDSDVLRSPGRKHPRLFNGFLHQWCTSAIQGSFRGDDMGD